MNALRRWALALIVLLAAVAPASAVERITQFISDVHVQRNGDLIVVETIRVEAEGNVIRRGGRRSSGQHTGDEILSDAPAGMRLRRRRCL